ncbi:MAG: small multi-drug export protein [Thermoplasmatales archaeon]|nr:MAG: small multi-drug export protein [Thermoplasmatales archaeon]
MEIKNKGKTMIRFGKLVIPPILGFGVYGIWGLLSDELGKIWPLLLAYFFPPFGKETVIPLGIGVLKKGLTIPFLNIRVDPVSINPLSMALAVAFIDIVIALFLVWNYDLAKKIPLVGKFIEKIENIGETSSDKYGWIKPLRFIGIILFVMVPFQGSGGLVGSIVGRLIGMKPRNTFIAICIGAIVGCTLIAYFADLILNVFVKNFLVGLLIIIILAVILIMIFVYKKTSNNEKK